IVEGGSGTDRLLVDNSADDGPRQVALTPTGILGLVVDGITVTDFDDIELSLGAANDVVTVQGTDADARYAVNTGGGDDRVLGANASSPLVLRGQGGDDLLQGGPLNDLFVWNEGDGSDRVDGGDGVDTLAVTTSNAADALAVGPAGSRVMVGRSSPG